MLNITTGNIAPLRAVLKMGEEPFPVSLSENVQVALYSGLGTRWGVDDFEVSDGEDNVVYIDAPATLPKQVYGLEVKGKINGLPWCTKTPRVLEVTNHTEPERGGTVTPAGDRYDIVMSVEMYKTKDIIPTALADLSSDSQHRTVTDEEKQAWNNKSDFRGSYNDLEDKPDLTSYQQKEQGKGLSTNDYTNEDKGKLGALPTNSELQQEFGGKQDTIDDLRSIRSGAAAGSTAYQKPVGGIPSTDMSQEVQTSLAKAEAAAPQSTTYTKTEVDNKLDAVNEKIPAAASSSNQLADKDFVNSSISTATATYRGAYNLVNDLSLTTAATEQQIGAALATKMTALGVTPDNNDYCFVQIPTADATPTQIARVDRYKYNGTAWSLEFTLNNSGFTAAQWAALNSGVTSGLMAKLMGLPTSSELTALLGGKQDVIDSSHKLSADLLQDGTNNKVYTDAEKTKLGGIESGAQVNVKPDWNAGSGSSAEILNKPTIPTVPTISTDIDTDGTSDTKTASPKAVKTFVEGKGYAASSSLPTTMGASGSGHKGGLVPDTPSTAGTTKFLREDGTWQEIDMSGKEDVVSIVAPVNQSNAANPITTLTCEAGKYYRIAVAVETLAVTLPAITDTTKVKTIVLFLTGGTTPAVTISSTAPRGGTAPAVYYSNGYAIESGKTYEVNCLWNGAAWIVATVEISLS